jgi:hypothetical protein
MLIKANSHFSLSFFVNLVLALLIDLVVAAMANIRSLGADTFVTIVNSLLAVCTVCGYGYLCVLVWIKAKTGLKHFEKSKKIEN